MKTKLITISSLLATAFVIATLFLKADEPDQQVRKFEYVTIRWSGRDNTHLVRPSGQVEFVAAQIQKLAKPNRADDRSFYLNILMNGLAKEGYEFAGISNDDIVMKRAATR